MVSRNVAESAPYRHLLESSSQEGVPLNDGKSQKEGPGGPGDLETARVKSPLSLLPLPGPPGLLSGSSAQGRARKKARRTRGP